MSSEFNFTYNASPTGSLFHKDRSRIRAIMGPVGSGKTSTCVVDLFMWGAQQKPSKDKIRRTRFAVVRATYPELEATTIETFVNWFGPILRIKRTTPIRGYIDFPLDDGTVVNIELVFIALDREEDIARKLKSFELTGAFINEASEVSETVFTNLKERIGRYPSTHTGAGPSFSGIILDTNPPSNRHWFYSTFEVNKPKGHVLYVQPPAVMLDRHSAQVHDVQGNGYSVNPDAENISNLEEGFEYYLNAIPGQSESHVRNRYMGEYGSVHTDGAVYTNFSKEHHVSKTPLPIQYGERVYLGFDWGLHPAMIACQLSPSGTLLFLDEIAPEDETNLNDFLDTKVVPLLRRRYMGCPIVGIGDPAGGQRSDLAKFDRFKAVSQRGIPVRRARTNDPTARKEGLDHFLNMRGGMVVDGDRCPIFAEALNGGYQFTRPINDGMSERFKKNYFSHIMDAAQYIAMELKMGILSGGSDFLGLPEGMMTSNLKKPLRVNSSFGMNQQSPMSKGYLWA